VYQVKIALNNCKYLEFSARKIATASPRLCFETPTKEAFGLAVISFPIYSLISSVVANSSSKLTMDVLIAMKRLKTDLMTQRHLDVSS
jgi:hypothetical protein